MDVDLRRFGVTILRYLQTRLFRYSYYFIAVVIIVFAVSLQMARMLAPQVREFRPDIEEFLGSRLGHSVAIAKIEAQWRGLAPRVLIEHLNIVDKNKSVLKVDAAVLTLDVLSSLMHFQWVWKSVDVVNVDMDFQQNNQGQWQLLNIPFENNGNSSWKADDLFVFFGIAPKVHLTNINADFYFQKGMVLSSTIPSAAIENDGSFHRLLTSLNIDNKVVANLVVEKKPGAGLKDYISAYIQFKQFPLGKIINGLELKENPVVQSDSIPHIKSTKIDGSVWFDFKDNDQVKFYGEVFSHKVPISAYIKGGRINDVAISAEIQGDLSSDEEFSFGLSDLTFNGEQALGQLLYQKNGDKDSIWLDELKLQSTSRLFLDIFSNVEQYRKVTNFIETASPIGIVNNISIDIDRHDWKKSEVKANVQDVSVNPVNKIPGLYNVNGYVQSDLYSGYVDFLSDRFLLFPQTVYEKPLWFRRASGQVAWSLRPEGNQIIVLSNKLSINTDFGLASGYFYLDVPWVSGSRKSDFALHIGLKNSKAEHYKKLVPKTVPKNLISWLDKSVQSATVPEAGFIYRGGFSGGDSIRSVQLFVTIEDGGLVYSQDWPALESINGQVIVDNRIVNASVQQASVFDESIENIKVKWPANEQRDLNVAVNSQLPASTALRFLNETWLTNKVGDTFVNWSASGDVGVQVDVDIPIFADADSEYNPKQRASISFLHSKVHMDDVNLLFEDISGDLDFSNSDGFYSSNIQFKLFDKDVNVNVGNVQKDNERFLFVSGDGSVEVDKVLSWLATEPSHGSIEGSSPYEFDLRIPLNNESVSYKPRLTVTSDLEGISIDLPKPFRKSKSEIKSLKLVAQLEKGKSKHKLSLGDNINIKFQKTIDAVSGALLINRKSVADSDLPDNNFFIGADFEDVSIEPWMEILKQYGNSGQAAEELNLNYDVRAKNVYLKGSVFKDVAFSGGKSNNIWQANIKSSRLAGNVEFDHDLVNPIKLHLDYLRLPETKEDENKKEGDSELDPLADIDFSILKPANVHIDQLLYGNRNLGYWRFNMIPYKDGVDIKDVVSKFSGFTLKGKSNKGAYLRWYKKDNSDGDPTMYTEFNAQLQGKEIQRIFEDWGYPVLIKSQNASFGIDVAWQGSPAVFSVDKLSGSVRISMKDGVFVQDKQRTSTGFLRLLSLFNFDTWLRRLSLNFSDLSKKGVVYDSLTSYVILDAGWMYFQEPFYAKGPASDFTLAGKLYYPEQKIDGILVATVPASGNLTLAAALAGGLPTALGVYIAGRIFKKQVDKISSLTYSVKGDWADPKVDLVDVFGNNSGSDSGSDGGKSGSAEQPVKSGVQ